MVFPTWIVTLLSALLPVIAAQGREITITCVCTTTHCREFGLRVCNTTGLCFSQYLDRRDGTDPLVRGCIDGRTPLLCENRPPAVAQHRGWPVLICCDKNMCNARATPTIPTSTEEVTTEAVMLNNSSDVRSSTFPKADLPSSVVIALILIAILAVIAFIILTFYLTRREVIVFNPEYGRVSTTGYVKGCPQMPPSSQKGLDNGFTTVDT